jgi:hypothetical protein
LFHYGSCSVSILAICSFSTFYMFLF